MDTFYCRIISLTDAFPRFSTIRCRGPDLPAAVQRELSTWEPFDVVEVRDAKDVLVLMVASNDGSLKN